MTTRDYASERYSRRTRALERLAATKEYEADSLDRLASALETLALAQAIAASKVGSYGWVNASLDKLLGRLWTRVTK